MNLQAEIAHRRKLAVVECIREKAILVASTFGMREQRYSTTESYLYEGALRIEVFVPGAHDGKGPTVRIRFTGDHADARFRYLYEEAEGEVRGYRPADFWEKHLDDLAACARTHGSHVAAAKAVLLGFAEQDRITAERQRWGL